MLFDEIILHRCFQLAKRGGKFVKSNPQVGAVLVHRDRIIGEGYHEAYGFSHAEVNAIQSVEPEDKDKIPECTLYISLEPCNHFGKTPPCAELILKQGIKSVKISCLDPNPKMSGKSVRYLRENDCHVTTDILVQEGMALIHPFLVFNQKRRPYITLKFAQSKDGFMGDPNTRIHLSNHVSNVLVHKWRSEMDAILVGVNTVNCDNPSLTTRLYPGESPLRILIDPNARANIDHELLADHEPCLIITKSKKYPVDKTLKDVFVVPEEDQILDIVMSLLYKKNITRLLVEGGRTTLLTFIEQGLWDEARIVRTPKVLEKGIKAPAVEGSLIERFYLKEDEIIRFKNTSD